MKIDFRKEGLFIMIPPGLLTPTLIVWVQLAAWATRPVGSHAKAMSTVQLTRGNQRLEIYSAVE